VALAHQDQGLRELHLLLFYRFVGELQLLYFQFGGLVVTVPLSKLFLQISGLKGNLLFRKLLLRNPLI
jgi:hypothetical protein